MVLALGAQAQEGVPRNLDLSLRAESGAVAGLIAAQDLFALAQARKDPLAALGGARIMAGIAFSPVSRVPQVGQAGAEGAPTFATAALMFDLARGLALDEGLAALVEAERIGQSGPASQTVALSVGTVAAGGEDRWDLAFYAGALAEVAVVGAGIGVLDIRVEDGSGQLICQQSGPRDRMYCPFVPRENGVFSVRVGNPGSGSAGYALITN